VSVLGTTSTSFDVIPLWGTWHTTKHSPLVTLSGGNLTATYAYPALVAPMAPVLSTAYASTGYRYFELTQGFYTQPLSFSGFRLAYIGIGPVQTDAVATQNPPVYAVGATSGYPLYGTSYAFQVLNSQPGANAQLSKTASNSGATSLGNWPVTQTGDVFGLLVDFEVGTIEFRRNDTVIGSFTGLSLGDTPRAPHLSFRPSTDLSSPEEPEDATYTANFGASAWVYTPPAGYTGWYE